MTGVDVDHTKALAAKFDPAAPSQYLAKLGREVVAAVERVQALHTPVCEHSGANCKEEDCCMLICQECGTDHPCETRKALETP